MLSKILYSKLTQINLQTNMESIKEGASSSLNTSFGFFSQIKPYAVQILLGASVGFIAGYTFRKVARSLAILIIAMAAILFILINYTDLINIAFFLGYSKEIVLLTGKPLKLFKEDWLQFLRYFLKRVKS